VAATTRVMQAVSLIRSTLARAGDLPFHESADWAETHHARITEGEFQVSSGTCILAECYPPVSDHSTIFGFCLEKAILRQSCRAPRGHHESCKWALQDRNLQGSHLAEPEVGGVKFINKAYIEGRDSRVGSDGKQRVLFTLKQGY
jgi:hypothetical protein